MKFLIMPSNQSCLFALLALVVVAASSQDAVATEQGLGRHSKQQQGQQQEQHNAEVFVRTAYQRRRQDDEYDVVDGGEDVLLFASWRHLQTNNATTNTTTATNTTSAPVPAPVVNETDSTTTTNATSTPVPSPPVNATIPPVVNETDSTTNPNTTTSTPVPSPMVNETDTTTGNNSTNSPNANNNTTNTTTSTTAVPTASQMPSISPPTPAPVPRTPYPTPSTPFEYAKWGDSTFGYKYQNVYEQAFQLSTRRPGWSWHEPLAGYAPFCYEDTCYDVTEPCLQYGGILLNNVSCAFPEDVKIAGPSCWKGNCTTSGGREACDSVGGLTVGDDNRVQWCLFKDARTLLGPACYRNNCYKTELQAYCDGAGGVVWNEDFCFVPGWHTVIGPVCWEEYCFAGSLKLQCDSMGGTALAERWCVVEGCDRTVVGPLCSKAEDSFLEECYGEAATELCAQLNGVLFADFLCVIEGTDWTVMGPNAYGLDGDTRGITNRLCRELQDNIGGPFSGLETYNIEGRFCLIKMRLPPVGPFCLDEECQPELGTEFCTAFGGEDLAGFMCLLPPEYQQGFGPLMWNDNMLEGLNGTCVGQYCAIKFDSYDTDMNLRCPASGPILKAPTPVPPPATPSPQPTFEDGTTAPPGSNAASGAVSVFKPLVSLLLAMAVSSVFSCLTRM